MSSAQQVARQVHTILASVRTADARIPGDRIDLTATGTLLRARRKLCDFLVEPSTVDPTLWTLDHEPIRRIYEAFLALRDAFEVFDSFDSVKRMDIPTGPTVKCVRIMWPWIAKWLDVFLPTNSGIDTKGSHGAVLHLLCAILEAIFMRKPFFEDVIAETPWIYASLYRLWLRLDHYITPALIRSMPEIVNVDAMLSFAIAGGTRLGVDGVMQPGSKGYRADPLAIGGALAVVQDANRFYRLAIRAAFRLLRRPALTPPNSLEIALQTLTSLLRSDNMPMATPSRKVVRAAVRLLREVLLRHRMYGDAVLFAAQFLHQFFWTTNDNKMMIWSIRAGALPMFLLVNKVRPDFPAAAYLKSIACQTICPDVLRAVVKYKGDSLGIFRDASFADEDVLSRVDVVVDTRWKFLQGRKDDLRECGHDQCNGPVGLTRRCPCHQIAYCSKECQRADWPLHKEVCSSPIIDGMRDVPGREIDFAVLCSAFQIYVLGKEFAEYLEGLRHQHRRLRRAKVIVDNSQIPVKFEVGVDIEGEGTGDITVLGLAYVKRGSGFFLVRLEINKILAKVKATDARRAYHRSGPEFTPIKALHSAREKLDDLLVDPLSLDPAAWTLSHHTVRRAYEAFVALIDAFDAFEAKWLDALLPVRGVINLEDSHDVVLSKLCATLEILFRRIDHLRDVLATTPWIYATVCKLSLYLPRYTQTDPAAKRGTLYVMDTDSKLSFVLFFATELKGPSSKDRGPTLDPLVHQGILEAVGRDLELLYHLALRQIFRILAYSLSPVRSLTASIKALTRIASRGLTLPQPSRRVSRAAVHLLRELLGQRRLPDIATYASELLCTILSTVTNDRMLTWALRDGALPLLAHMSRVQQAGAAAAYLKMIASQTISPRVLRALAHGNGGKPRSLRGAGFADEQTLEEVDAVVAERWLSLQARNKRLKRLFLTGWGTSSVLMLPGCVLLLGLSAPSLAKP
ncbi:hypothetical protein GGF50DRAFT_56913 [Schizophyllum commune]